ncbi:Solute carrier organic anion transporter family member 1C1 [Acipenser ruthenus]|uniref:Solute carrier organic anion transporter family member 1C1 n=1 Tax=Acipenser ruthenus TaxID=7906 RepID=A0A662YT65_ACIRT|nr:Solute carrier organic anion transporter family member 1C1 [Acipenser ruthenus]
MTVETRAEGFSDPPLKKELSPLEDPAEAKTRKCCTPNIKMFLVALSFTYFSKALSGSYMKSSITQIERRFEIPSSVIGVIDGSFEMGCLHTIAVIGPLFGFTLGSFCAKLYVDIGFVDLESITISMKDSRWVGAWWLGFIIAGGTSLVSAFPFFFLPKTLPKEGGPEKDSTAAAEQNLLQGNQQTNATDEQPKIIDVAKDFLPSLKRLLTNKIYVLYLIANVIMFNGVIILITYTPKYLEQQFGESASKANFLIGVTSMPAVSLGIFFSGLIMKKFKLDLMGATKMGLGTAIIGSLCILPYFALTCENTEIAGLTVSYGGCVDPELKSLSVGMYTLALRAFGGIPAPIYFGALIDSTCMKWGTKKCGGRGACRVYDNISFRLLFLGLILGLRLMGCVFFGFVIIQIKKKFTRDHRKASAEVKVFLKQDMKNNVLPEQKGAGLSEKEVETST